MEREDGVGEGGWMNAGSTCLPGSTGQGERERKWRREGDIERDRER